MRAAGRGRFACAPPHSPPRHHCRPPIPPSSCTARRGARLVAGRLGTWDAARGRGSRGGPAPGGGAGPRMARARTHTRARARAWGPGADLAGRPRRRGRGQGGGAGREVEGVLCCPDRDSRVGAAFSLRVLLSPSEEERWRGPHCAGPGRHLKATGARLGNREQGGDLAMLPRLAQLALPLGHWTVEGDWGGPGRARPVRVGACGRARACLVVPPRSEGGWGWGMGK